MGENAIPPAPRRAAFVKEADKQQDPD